MLILQILNEIAVAVLMIYGEKRLLLIFLFLKRKLLGKSFWCEKSKLLSPGVGICE